MMIYLLKPMIFQFATLNNQRVIIKPSLKKLEEVSEILPWREDLKISKHRWNQKVWQNYTKLVYSNAQKS
jgi:hypothetical protein